VVLDLWWREVNGAKIFVLAQIQTSSTESEARQNLRPLTLVTTVRLLCVRGLALHRSQADEPVCNPAMGAVKRRHRQLFVKNSVEPSEAHTREVESGESEPVWDISLIFMVWH